MHELAASHQLLMSDALFYELISNPDDRRQCFSKFLNVENPVSLVLHVGGHLRIEIDTHQPSGKPSHHIENVRFQLNERLLDPDYQLPEYAKSAVEEQAADLQDDVVSLIKRARMIPTRFPNLLSGSDAQRALARNEAEKIITTDTGFLLDFYTQLKPPTAQTTLPPAQLLTPEWALFRSVQVQLLFALDLYTRSNGNIPDELTPKMYTKFEHDVLDAEYMILGVLEGSFATYEPKLRRWWPLLCPEGSLYQ